MKCIFILNKYMNELSQILQSEQEGADKINKASQAASLLIEEKKKEFALKLEKESEMTEEEKRKIILEKENQLKDIGKEFEEKTELELEKIKENAKKRLEEAAENVIRNSFTV